MQKLTKKRGLGKLMEACQLRDFHLHLPKTATQASGSQPIDCIIGSTIISEHVIRAGYTAFYEVLSSDHRGLFVDIDAAKFFGTKNPDATRPASRLLKSNDKRTVGIYTKHLKANIRDIAKIFKDIECTATSPEEAKARYDTVDDKLGEIMEESELKCARPRRDSLWSKKLKAAELLVRYWKARRIQLKSKRSLDKAIQRLRQELHDLLPEEADENRDGDTAPEETRDKISGRVEDNGIMTSKYVRAKMKQAISHLKHARCNDAANREKFLENEAKAAMIKGDKKRAQRLQRLANAERMKRSSYARIRNALQEKRQGSIISSLKLVEQDEEMGIPKLSKSPIPWKLRHESWNGTKCTSSKHTKLHSLIQGFSISSTMPRTTSYAKTFWKDNQWTWQSKILMKSRSLSKPWPDHPASRTMQIGYHLRSPRKMSKKDS
jgi:hypothetical protein